VYRTGKRIFDQVSEAVVSHQIQKRIKTKSLALSTGGTGGSDGSLGSFFNTEKKPSKKPSNDAERRTMENDTMSLVLFEQVSSVF